MTCQNQNWFAFPTLHLLLLTTAKPTSVNASILFLYQWIYRTDRITITCSLKIIFWQRKVSSRSPKQLHAEHSSNIQCRPHCCSNFCRIKTRSMYQTDIQACLCYSSRDFLVAMLGWTTSKTAMEGDKWKQDETPKEHRLIPTKYTTTIHGYRKIPHKCQHL
jgi:hypothetical protein